MCGMSKLQKKHLGKLRQFEFGEHDLCVIRYALNQQLKKTNRHIRLLKIAVKRELTDTEIEELPNNLQKYSREGLIECIDTWVSLQKTCEWIIADLS